MTEKPRRQDILPRSLPPLGLRREVAAAYIDVSPTKFDQMVADGRMPKPKLIDTRRVWSRIEVEQAFARLPGGAEDEPEEDEWDFAPETPAQAELRKARELTPWERRLLLSLYRRGVPAAPSSLEGAGPQSRASLARRGFILDDGETLSLTDAGRELATDAARRWA